MSANVIKISADNPPSAIDCQIAAEYNTNPRVEISRILLLLLLFCQCAVFIRLAVEFRRRRATLLLHGNLRILYVNLVITYQLIPVGYFITDFTSFYFSIFLANSPCSMLVPLWYCFLSRSFIMAHTAAVPFLHFSIMLERLRATRLANSYEREGHNFGRLALAISYVLALSMVLVFDGFVFVEQNQDLSQLMTYNGVTIQSHPLVSPIWLAILLLVILLTAVGDLWLFAKNRALWEQKSIKNCTTLERYSLSEKYQIRENLTAMRLILPLDIGYLLVILLFNLVQLLLRIFRTSIGQIDYYAAYNYDYCFATLYTILSLVYYWRFLTKRSSAPADNRNLAAININRQQVIPQQVEAGQVYFEQLQNQWTKP